MYTLSISPVALEGQILIPSSKSMGHREIICAGLAVGTSVIDNVSLSKDIEATCRCLRAMGVTIEEVPGRYEGRHAFRITGTGSLRPLESQADCGESGSTLRFFIALAALMGAPFTFIGHGQLVRRPLKAYYDLFEQQGLSYRTTDGELPLTVDGRWRAGVYRLPGNISSQYVSGLLFALPLLDGDSVIEMTSPLESASYADLTISCLARYGIEIVNVDRAHRRYEIRGNQTYRPHDTDVEGDWSQVAFWTVGGALGNVIETHGLDHGSLQGDRAVVEIMQRMKADLSIGERSVKVARSVTEATVIDATDCPDIIPVLTVLASVSEGTTRIVNAARLRIKECDRLTAIATELNKLGADIEELPDGLIVRGRPEGLEGGCRVDAWNDHRIAMSLAVAAQRCRRPIELTGAMSVRKSYPNFWQDYVSVGGQIKELA